ncbi:hypothetical protein CDAR_222731 [Caerostris darwini]|uniref:Uncharacterized protein n=1 Tax=Caerostris darwini TaxID=1538125 RepID=A0AAV4NF10_9ARAC|nr:hypothetical protein CDAR_222731 [Caerostris darwini]
MSSKDLPKRTKKYEETGPFAVKSFRGEEINCFNVNRCGHTITGRAEQSGHITNLTELKARITQHINNVTPEILQSVVEPAVCRFQLVAENGG